MITVITGAPGSGKSAALVDLLSQLSKDRAVYCNGIPDLLVPHVHLEDPSAWTDTVPDGAIVVIDEVQRFWRPRGPGQRVPDDISALETHRHRGLDFYLVTQSPRLIDTNVRALVGRHVHLRDLGFLGRWWYEWPECSDNCASAWRQAPIKKRYRLPKSIFAQYKSASVHIKPIRSFPWLVVFFALALFLVGFLSWKTYSLIDAKIVPPKPGLSHTASSVGPTGSVSDIANGRRSESSGSAHRLIDDRLDWIPRVSNRPESAPAFDHLRIVVSMPRVVGGYCLPDLCVCITQQGTDPGLSQSECRRFIEHSPFDPYRRDPDHTQGRDDQTKTNAEPARPVS